MSNASDAPSPITASRTRKRGLSPGQSYAALNRIVYQQAFMLSTNDVSARTEDTAAGAHQRVGGTRRS